jgi:prepilin-type N-terminal cleavage/methylation domain-containing protein
MLARIRKAQEEHEGGFTLIELLVVIIIIGILAAIAIPVFLNQRKKAVDASMKSDLRTVATAEETYFVDNQAYVAVSPATANPTIGDVVKTSPNNTITVTLNYGGVAGTYCALANNSNGTQDWVYKSDQGGLQPASVKTC